MTRILESNKRMSLFELFEQTGHKVNVLKMNKIIAKRRTTRVVDVGGKVIFSQTIPDKRFLSTTYTSSGDHV